MSPTFYDRLGVDRGADAATIRAAYRSRALELHPDVSGRTGLAAQREMAELNEAWRTLRDAKSRVDYDASLPKVTRVFSTSTSTSAAAGTKPPGPPSPTSAPTVGGTVAGRMAPGWRREAWYGGIRVQIRRLSTQAARSAIQTILLRRRDWSRTELEAEVDPVVSHLLLDTQTRIRDARAAGAAPLDLGLAAALIGLHSLADGLVRAWHQPLSLHDSIQRQAEMVDRMWDTMAHEITHELAVALGDNPHVARRLGGRKRR